MNEHLFKHENWVKCRLKHQHVCFKNSFILLYIGNVLIVTFVASHSSHWQFDQEPSTDDAATDTGNFFHEPHAGRDRSYSFKDQHDVSNCVRASHSTIAEKVSLTGIQKSYLSFYWWHYITLTISKIKDMPTEHFLINVSPSLPLTHKLTCAY